jgi:hypothetical protein
VQPAGQDHGRIHLHRRHRWRSSLQNPRAGLHTSWSGGLSGADLRWHAHWAGRPPDVSRCLMFSDPAVSRGLSGALRVVLTSFTLLTASLCRGLLPSSTAVDYAAPRYPVSRDVHRNTQALYCANTRRRGAQPARFQPSCASVDAFNVSPAAGTLSSVCSFTWGWPVTGLEARSTDAPAAVPRNVVSLMLTQARSNTWG